MVILVGGGRRRGGMMNCFRENVLGRCAVVLVVGMGIGVGVGAEGKDEGRGVRLEERFGRLREKLGKGNGDRAGLVGEAVVVKMLRGGLPGKMWKAKLGETEFRLTIEDGLELKPEAALAVLEKLPPVYRRALVIVSEGKKDGAAYYKDLDGAAAHGSQDYLNMIAKADVSVVAHEAGHILEQRATAADPEVLARWKEAIAADKVSVSRYGDQVAHEDLAEFARVYALCLAGGKEALEELRTASPRRFEQWEAILKPAKKE